MNAEINLNGEILKSERLILRSWKLNDLEDFYEYASVDGVGQMADWMPHKDRNESKEILLHFIETKNNFAIELVDSKKVIGSISLELCKEEFKKDFKNLSGRELGYVINKNYWNRGYATEAAKTLINYCFTEEGYDYLYCSHLERNYKSKRVIEKCNFTFYREFDYDTVLNTREKVLMYVLYNKQEERAWKSPILN